DGLRKPDGDLLLPRLELEVRSRAWPLDHLELREERLERFPRIAVQLHQSMGRQNGEPIAVKIRERHHLPLGPPHARLGFLRFAPVANGGRVSVMAIRDDGPLEGEKIAAPKKDRDAADAVEGVKFTR